MTIESYNVTYKGQTEKAIRVEINNSEIWLPKSQIEVDGVSCDEDFKTLVPDEEVDCYIPDWLAEKHELI